MARHAVNVLRMITVPVARLDQQIVRLDIRTVRPGPMR